MYLADTACLSYATVGHPHGPAPSWLDWADREAVFGGAERQRLAGDPCTTPRWTQSAAGASYCETNWPRSRFDVALVSTSRVLFAAGAVSLWVRGLSRRIVDRGRATSRALPDRTPGRGALEVPNLPRPGTPGAPSRIRAPSVLRPRLAACGRHDRDGRLHVLLITSWSLGGRSMNRTLSFTAVALPACDGRRLSVPEMREPGAPLRCFGGTGAV